MPTPTGIRDRMAGPSVILPPAGRRVHIATLGTWGYPQTVNMGGPTSPDGHGTFGRNLQCGVAENLVEGNPGAPCLELKFPGFWRFRWTVKTGTHTIQVLTKQPANVTPFPSMKVKSNTAIGVPSDIEQFGSGGSGWSVIGPITISPTSVGVVWVELWNNCKLVAGSSAFFDHLIFT